MTKFNVPEKSPVHDFVQTFASLLIEILMENAYPLGLPLAELHALLVQATLDDVDNHVESGARIWPTEQDAKDIGESADGRVLQSARRRWPNIARCIETSMEGSFALQKPMPKAPVTIETLAQVAEHVEAQPHCPHWRVSVYNRAPGGLPRELYWRIEEEHVSMARTKAGVGSITLVMEAPTLQEAATKMVAHSRAMREIGVLP